MSVLVETPVHAAHRQHALPAIAVPMVTPPLVAPMRQQHVVACPTVRPMAPPMQQQGVVAVPLTVAVAGHMVAVNALAGSCYI